jgi:spore germination cell wall hydrolase CwlJ-like protein
MMRNFSRATLAVAPLACLLGAATFAVPSFASETPAAPAGTATAMLAAVTAPLLAVDVRKLEMRDDKDQSFSTSGQNDASSNSSSDDLAAAPQSLEQMVSNRTAYSAGDDEGDCLAASVYYESKGEPLSGQLAVAQTIINRTNSGRFPSSVCGVVRQPGQFSFLHGGQIPMPSRANAAWQRAVAIATIAREGLWKQVAPAALFFHARRVSPGWSKVKVASLGNHIFFR